jgi:hypothetical protein
VNETREGVVDMDGYWKSKEAVDITKRTLVNFYNSNALVQRIKKR